MQLLKLTLFTFIAVSALLTANAFGGWQPIKDLNDPYVKEVANFAVTEYNKQSGKNLKLDTINKGEDQVVPGRNYRLVIAVVDGTASKQYEAIVWDNLWKPVRILRSFKPVS